MMGIVSQPLGLLPSVFNSVRIFLCQVNQPQFIIYIVSTYKTNSILAINKIRLTFYEIIIIF